MSRSFLGLVCAVVVVFGAFAFWQNRLLARDVQAFAAPKLLPVHRLPIPADSQTATFAGGCFWGVEETFRRVPGVVDTQTGYAGGTSPNPTYRTVHRDTTGHVEAVRVVFDPARTTYTKLLAVFFEHRTVTTSAPANPIIGKAYRTFVFTQNAAQNGEAHAFIKRLSASEAQTSEGKGRAMRRVVVGVRAVGVFWPAEEEHQRYYEKRGGEAASGAACRL